MTVCESQMQITCVAAPPASANEPVTVVPVVLPFAGELIVTTGGATIVMQIVCDALPATFVAVIVKQWLPGVSTGGGTGFGHGIRFVPESQAQTTVLVAPPPRT